MTDQEPAGEVTVQLATAPVVGVPIDSYADARRLLRESRKERGLSCEALAEVLGCVPSLVSLREGGKRTAPGDDLIETFRKLGKRMVLVDL